MTGKVLAICQSCAEHNKAEWKNPHATPPLFLGICGCCKKIKPCVHIQYWKGIKPDGKFEVPTDEAAEKTEELENEAANNASSDESKPSAPAPKAPAAKNKASVLGK